MDFFLQYAGDGEGRGGVVGGFFAGDVEGAEGVGAVGAVLEEGFFALGEFLGALVLAEAISCSIASRHCLNSIISDHC